MFAVLTDTFDLSMLGLTLGGVEHPHTQRFTGEEEFSDRMRGSDFTSRVQSEAMGIYLARIICQPVMRSREPITMERGDVLFVVQLQKHIVLPDESEFDTVRRVPKDFFMIGIHARVLIMGLPSWA
jgi:hypothetical protein